MIQVKWHDLKKLSCSELYNQTAQKHVFGFSNLSLLKN